MRRHGRLAAVLGTAALATALVLALVVASGTGLRGGQRTVPPSEASSSTARTTASSRPTITLDDDGSGAPTWTGVEPSVIGFSGDAGDVLTDIVWTSWTPSRASGNGAWGHDDCAPDCASGTVTEYPGTVELSHPVDGHFRTVAETTSGPYGFRLSFADPSATGWRPWTTVTSRSSACQHLVMRPGRRIREGAQEQALVLELTNLGPRPCRIDGYPSVSVFSSAGHLIVFSYREGESRYESSRPPLPVLLEPRGHAYVLVAKAACTHGKEASGAAIRLAPPGVARTVRLRSHSIGVLDYCVAGTAGAGDSLAISPLASSVGRLLPS